MRRGSLPILSIPLLLLSSLFFFFFFFSAAAHGSRRLLMKIGDDFVAELQARHLQGEQPNPLAGGSESKWTTIELVIAITVPLLVIAIFLYIYLYWRNLPSISPCKDKSVEQILATLKELEVKRYCYSDLMHMTNGFCSMIGKGGFGTVYKGVLHDGTAMAVKILSETKATIEEFVNEISSIGTTKHINVVSLLGFCFEGTKRALIYEFMPNGSLDKFLFVEDPETTAILTWEKRLKVALGIARGLEYLHKGCNTPMIHFDIKPQNILLDHHFCPKISDFGLARLCKSNESVVSTICAMGTVGFIAPELICRNLGVISTKADVYSYGMVLLEMAGGRRNLNTEAENESQAYFPHWIREQLDHGSVLEIPGVTPATEDIARKMILVGLWCIQTNPTFRPWMSEVVGMLEGGVYSLMLPPKPYICPPSAHPLSSSYVSAIAL